MGPPILNLPPALKSRLSQGHPWVYRNQVTPEPDLASGAWVQVRCGSFSAFGLWDARSAIAVRLYSQRGLPGSDWVAGRVAEAWQVRAPLRAGATTGYRWVYGESDGLPGIVVDLYADFAVIQTYAESVETLLPWVTDALHAHTPLQGILWRPVGGQLKPLWGRLPPSDQIGRAHV